MRIFNEHLSRLELAYSHLCVSQDVVIQQEA